MSFDLRGGLGRTVGVAVLVISSEVIDTNQPPLAAHGSSVETMSAPPEVTDLSAALGTGLTA